MKGVRQIPSSAFCSFKQGFWLEAAHATASLNNPSAIDRSAKKSLTFVQCRFQIFICASPFESVCASSASLNGPPCKVVTFGAVFNHIKATQDRANHFSLTASFLLSACVHVSPEHAAKLSARAWRASKIPLSCICTHGTT